MNPDDILDDILDSDSPDNVQDVLDEAPILSVVTDPSKGDEILDRFEDYLNVVNDQGIFPPLFFDFFFFFFFFFFVPPNSFDKKEKVGTFF